MKKVITAALIAASLFSTWYWRFRKKKAEEKESLAAEVEAIDRSEVP